MADLRWVSLGTCPAGHRAIRDGRREVKGKGVQVKSVCRRLGVAAAVCTLNRSGGRRVVPGP